MASLGSMFSVTTVFDRVSARSKSIMEEAAMFDRRIGEWEEQGDVMVFWTAMDWVYPDPNYDGHPMSTFAVSTVAAYRAAVDALVKVGSYQHSCPHCP